MEEDLHLQREVWGVLVLVCVCGASGEGGKGAPVRVEAKELRLHPVDPEELLFFNQGGKGAR